MTVQEMTTGIPGMSAHELAVAWPAFFEYRERTARREREKNRTRI